jgi:hypothetical protein
MEKRTFLTLPGLELRSLLHPIRSQLLYRLCYTGSFLKRSIYIFHILWPKKLSYSGRQIHRTPTLYNIIIFCNEHIFIFSSHNHVISLQDYTNFCMKAHEYWRKLCLETIHQVTWTLIYNLHWRLDALRAVRKRISYILPSTFFFFPNFMLVTLQGTAVSRGYLQVGQIIYACYGTLAIGSSLG